MRILLVLVVGLVAGCGSIASSPNPTATTTPSTATGRLSWSQPPAMSINSHATYDAEMETTDGNFVVHLLPKVAPHTVNNFVFLARHGFYNDVIFHRIINNFMVQTGDPTGTGSGGPGYTFANEKVTLPYALGTVAMANSGVNTNGSQFFIIVAKKYNLAPNYTIFGKISSGIDVVLKLAKTPVGPNPGSGEVSYPLGTPPKINKIVIRQS